MLSQSWAPLRAKIALFLRTVMHIINLFYLLFSVTVLIILYVHLFSLCYCLNKKNIIITDKETYTLRKTKY